MSLAPSIPTPNPAPALQRPIRKPEEAALILGIQRLTRKPEEVAVMLGIIRMNTYKLINEGKLRHVRNGRTILIPLSAIDEFLSGTGAGK